MLVTFFFIFIIDTNTNGPVSSPDSAHLHSVSGPPSLWPSPHYCLGLWVRYRCSLASFSQCPPAAWPLTAVSLIHVSMPLFLFCSPVYFVQLAPHVSEIIWYLSLTDWLISFSLIISRSTHVITKAKISFLYGCIVFRCINVPQHFCPGIYWWELGLFPDLGYCKQCCHGHSGVYWWLLMYARCDFFCNFFPKFP